MKAETRKSIGLIAGSISMAFALAMGLVAVPQRAFAQDQYAPVEPDKPPQPTGSVMPYVPNGSTSSVYVPFPFVVVIRSPQKPSMNVFFPEVFVPNEDIGGSLDSFPGIGRLNKSILPGVILATEGKPLAVKDGRFTVKLNDGPVTKLQMLDEKGNLLAGFDLHTGPKPKPLDNFYVPSSAAIGSTMNVWVPKANIGDPLRDDMKILIGGREMPNLAASSVDRLTRIDYDTPGPTEIEIKLGPFSFKKSFRVLKLDLAADHLNLLKRQTATVQITVHGLQKLRAPAHMKIAVTGAVTMSGESEFVIPPGEISADGTYHTTRVLQAGETPGTFGMNVTVTVDKEP